MLAKTRWGYETFATGGNEQAAVYAGIPTNWVRIRAYLLSSLCATLAGADDVAQDKGVTAQSGLGAELIVIAAVIIGGASILGGRGRVIGSCLGAVLVVLIDKVLREGWPIGPHRSRSTAARCGAGDPSAAGGRGAGASSACFCRRGAGRALDHPPQAARPASGPGCAASRRRRRSRAAAIAIEARADHGTVASDRALQRPGFGKFLARRDALAIILAVRAVAHRALSAARYLVATSTTASRSCSTIPSWRCSPIGLTYVIATGDIDLSVGAVLALAGADGGVRL